MTVLIGDQSHVNRGVVITTVIVGVFLVCIAVWVLSRRKRRCRGKKFTAAFDCLTIYICIIFTQSKAFQFSCRDFKQK